MVRKYLGFYKHSDGSREGYLSKTPTIEEIALQTKYSIALLIDACEELAKKGYIQYESKDLYVPRRSKIYILAAGKEAYEYAEYPRLILKIWGKRIAAVVAALITIFTLWHFIFPKKEIDKSASQPAPAKVDTTRHTQ